MSEATDIADILRGFRALKRLVEGEPRGLDPRMVEQGFSALGRRKHINAVKRRVAEAIARGVSPSTLGAAIDGERYLLTQESIAEELGQLTVANARKSQRKRAEKRLERQVDAAGGEDDAEACRRVMAEMLAVRGVAR
jgi:hypothetical protein